MKTKIILFASFIFSIICFFPAITNASSGLAGKIFLQVEENGEAWYVDPDTNKRAYLGRPADAFKIMRELGLGIVHGQLQEYLNSDFPTNLGGKIMLDVEENGEAYYINPDDLQGYYLGRPADAFKVMREQGIGISNQDLFRIPVHEKYKYYDVNKNVSNESNEVPMESSGLSIKYINYDGGEEWAEPSEYVTIENKSEEDIDMEGYSLNDGGEKVYYFTDIILEAGDDINLYTGCGADGSGKLYWCNIRSEIWSNKGGTAYLENSSGARIDKYSY